MAFLIKLILLLNFSALLLLSFFINDAEGFVCAENMQINVSNYQLQI